MYEVGLGVAWLPVHGQSVGSDRLNSGQALASGQAIVSPDGHFELAMQTDGNLVVYNRDPAARDHALWSANSNSCGGTRASMQTDGNFVVYNASGHACWASGTAGKGGSSLVMQNDGNLVVYDSKQHPLWSSGTFGGHRPSSGNAITNIVSAVEKIPVIGNVVSLTGQVYGAPVRLVADIASGARLDHVALDALKDQIKTIRDVAPYAQTVVSLVPGVGTGVSAAIGAGAALVEGQSITSAVKAGIRGAIPGGPLAAAAFDTALKVASGENVGMAALESARAAIPPGAAQAAFDVGLAVVTGEKLQTALAKGLVDIAPGQLQTVLAAGSQAIATTPGLADAIKNIAPGAATNGFHLAAGLLSHAGVNEKALAEVRAQLAPDVRSGFDAALQTQEAHTPWLKNVVSAPVAAAAPTPTATLLNPTPKAPAPPKPTAALLQPTPKAPAKPAYPPYPKVGVTGTLAAATTWGPATTEMSKDMRWAGLSAVNGSKGRPRRVAGPDGVDYLFAIENGALTARREVT